VQTPWTTATSPRGLKISVTHRAALIVCPVAVETHSTERTLSSVKERMRVKQGRLTIAVVYTDKSTAADGILKIKLSGGQLGKGNLQVIGSNTASTLPRGIAASLQRQSGATVQVLTSDASCFGRLSPG
jgi:hypothetical protein